MNVTSLYLTVLLLSPLAASCASSGAAQPNQEEMTAKWMAFMTPGPGHKLLDSKVGRWSGNLTMWNGPEAPPTQATGSSEFAWILGGRYLQDTTTAEIEGRPFRGIGTTAYDNIKHRYVATWIDDMGTGVTVSEGNYDEATHTFRYTSQMPDPFQGKYVKGRSVETKVDADHWILEMYSTSAQGKEFKAMEIHYTRAK